jgi:hypothetical protein
MHAHTIHTYNEHVHGMPMAHAHPRCAQ